MLVTSHSLFWAHVHIMVASFHWVGWWWLLLVVVFLLYCDISNFKSLYIFQSFTAFSLSGWFLCLILVVLDHFLPSGRTRYLELTLYISCPGPKSLKKPWFLFSRKWYTATTVWTLRAWLADISKFLSGWT